MRKFRCLWGTSGVGSICLSPNKPFIPIRGDVENSRVFADQEKRREVQCSTARLANSKNGERAIGIETSSFAQGKLALNVGTIAPSYGIFDCCG